MPRNFETWMNVIHVMKNIAERKGGDYSAYIDNIGITGKIGCAARIMDKSSRIWNLCMKELKGEERSVSDETLLDTCVDLANYAIFMVLLDKNKWDEFNGRSER